ncbi:D-beta-D-heptose 7-phosphate kinase/D-beta-D-heptose 1-phosphate adenosyltransferase [Rhizobium sp. BK226]|uniref:bifunctional D-glycero-beta-D-manno-heptose-7-phosphate kinase/D-glycero-beta-D-manno-heptose 1-phosphate adenylyltransferase HldE n=1 Tax=Rhizobium sp. BK226 TaxID=2587075 RepID=UPI001621F1D6|nr:bifunctional D-glycero-beta-D-manno-heptose-7-phosphate kinase/D-glycero-beta-D-manno-heptose 1-phosphate adenylyltransferase HldE [Rhizobium sp. BK226]MBB4116331.1 D-beta-D-heptose 7-phosphate kinase/D-beta-D-heptose 1-phosphate adenosyltransferase [Rhizobium sp. BK226]
MSRSLAEVVHQAFRREAQVPARVLVIGDLMLDRYLWGDVERISPEAPVPVVRVTRSSDRLGGSANVAANLVGLGLEAALAGHVGADADAVRIEEMLEEAGIAPFLTRTRGRATITKARVLGGHQQMLRLDQEDTAAVTEAASQELLDTVLSLFDGWKPGVVILSDYAKGTLTPSVCQAVIEFARARKIPVLVDPKGREYVKYRGATALTPNQKEAAEACNCGVRDFEAILAGAETLRRELDLSFLPVTRGEHGIALMEAGKVNHLPATAKQVFDVSGAGDTVIATLAAGLLAGLSPTDSCRLANLAAGVVVGKVGTVPIARDDLLHEIEWQDARGQADKICEEDILHRRVARWRDRGETIVFTNGCFDLLHAGHVTYLEMARAQGDRLVLGLNTDRSVRALKGANRPIIGEQDRARVLAALESVDAVVLFDEDTPERLICSLLPDVLVKGGDYKPEDIAGGDCVRKNGGEVHVLTFVDGRSTSHIVAAIKAG